MLFDSWAGVLPPPLFRGPCDRAGGRIIASALRARVPAAYR